MNSIVVKFGLLSLLLLSFSLNSQELLNPNVNLSIQEKPISEILKVLEEQCACKFAYRVFDLSKTKSLTYEGGLRGALDILFQEEPIDYKIIGNNVVLRKNRVVGQKIRGIVIDAVTNVPLIGATVAVLGKDGFGSTTDLDGKFQISGLYVGRYDLEVQYLGFESRKLNQIQVTSGKEVFLNVDMQESVIALNEVVVTSKIDLARPINEMSTNSARSFSVEETQRYAAAISDPARMAQSFAGVSSGGDDLSNEILIRGNSARGLLWRLEGVEIPNPNHFAGYVSGGGAISMLSASTLTDSDFYTGAFPAEFGNALSGVFDLSLRNGNSDKFEHSIAFGNLGFDVSSEGYFSKKSNASYLFNARYSTLELIDQFLPTVTGGIPAYRDLSLKINVPTKKAGTWSLFGLGGINAQIKEVVQDSSAWQSLNDQLYVEESQEMGLLGLTHKMLLKNNGYLKSTVMFSYYHFFDQYEKIFPSLNYEGRKVDGSTFRNYDINITSNYQKKYSAKHNTKTGFTIQRKAYSYDFETTPPLLFFKDFDTDIEDQLIVFLEDAQHSYFLQTYYQWQFKPSQAIEINTGINFSHLFLNNTSALDPRFGLKYFKDEKTILSLSLGLHSKPEHTSTYFIQSVNEQGSTQSNLDLKMSRAFHSVLGYDYRFTPNLRLKVEAYYQYLFNIPISTVPGTGFSILNAEDIFDIVFENNGGQGALVNDGLGNNYGLDFTLEKFFSNSTYFLLTSSLFNSRYTDIQGNWYPSFAANNFLFNSLGGKEWILGKLKKQVLGVNAKFTYYAGRRDHPIDLESSRINQREIRELDSFFSNRLSPYIRLDLGFMYRINFNRTTHSLHLDIQNIFNRFNILSKAYSNVSGQIVDIRQNGLIQFMTYRIQFSGKEK